MQMRATLHTFIQTLAVSMLLAGCSLCGNEIGYEEKSPNGQLKAVAFERDCGATTSFSTHISILPTNQKLPNEGGNVWVAKGDLKVRLRWEANDRIVVTYPTDARIIMKQEKRSGVSIRYESLP